MHIKKFINNKVVYSVTILSLFVLFFAYNVADAATLQINSNSTQVSVGDTAIMTVILNSDGIAVNNAEAVIKYPADLFDVLSISKSSSIFSLWVEDPSYSNSSGVITFNGGLPTPGFSGSFGQVVSVVVKAKKAGQGAFTFYSAAVRANDGLGTDVLSTKTGKTISVAVKEVPIVAPSAGPALKISSLTHPDQDQWYKDKNAVFQWTLHDGSNSVQTSIGSDASSIPHVIYIPAISKKSVTDLKDGVWYFKVRDRIGSVWNSTATYIVRIDNAPPIKKNVSFAYDDNAKILSISADIQDITSGIDHYDIFINDALVKSVPVKEFANGNYKLSFNSPGDNNVRLIAVDRAGNSVEAAGSFETSVNTAPQLDQVQSIISSNEQLLISGTVQKFISDVTVNIKDSNGVLITLKANSNNDGSFYVLAPKLNPSHYEIWAEIGSDKNLVSSEHVQVEVTSQLLVKVGPYTTLISYAIGAVALLIILTILFTYFWIHHRSKNRHKLKMRTALAKGNKIKVLTLLKDRLEKHIEILQRVRHGRILTKEEKEIKEAIESDLDEVDKAIVDLSGK